MCPRQRLAEAIWRPAPPAALPSSPWLQRFLVLSNTLTTASLRRRDGALVLVRALDPPPGAPDELTVLPEPEAPEGADPLHMFRLADRPFALLVPILIRQAEQVVVLGAVGLGSRRDGRSMGSGRSGTWSMRWR